METPRRVQPRLGPTSISQTNEPVVERSVKKKPIEVMPSPLIDHARVLYPTRLKHQKFTREHGNFLDMFKHLKINLPFIEPSIICPNKPSFGKISLN